MLFNSFIFIFAFLPSTLLIFYVLGRYSQAVAKLALVLLSLGFYACWRPIQLPILLFSIIFNYLIGAQIQQSLSRGKEKLIKIWLAFGVIVDLGLLGWFKYANFFVDNINIFGANIKLAPIALPLAISFFTFQKLAYLMDSAEGHAKKISFLDFSLFAAFFPQLIAGPIVHYKQIIPQIERKIFSKPIGRNFLVGLLMFSMGLFKKTVIADTLAIYVNPMFDTAEAHTIGLAYGWLAAMTYTLQLYFDFSGYSDMAIGLGRMLGVKLPLNFHSPLRAHSIMEYWRRWHMTLQQLIVAYVFQPLSLPLNRLAAAWGLRGWLAFLVGVGIPVFVTFVAIGVWHGAGWTFILFGVLHAIYVAANEAWREFGKQRRRRLRRAGRTTREPGPMGKVLSHLLTLVAVMFGNTLFRAKSVNDAIHLWLGMVGRHGVSPGPVPHYGWPLLALIGAGYATVFLAPNTQQIMGRFDPAYNWNEWKNIGRPPLPWVWKPNLAGLLFAGAALFLGIVFIERGRAIFLYFNF